VKKKDLEKNNLPDKPGVYLFKDKDANIIYIGKATSLKMRTKSYFDKDLINTRGLKIVTMVEVAESIDFKITNSVIEALLLESKLIKEYQPIFNTKEKDDKSFYVCVITKEDFPRVLLTRARDIEKKFPSGQVSKIYGPFTSGSSLKEALKIIRTFFPFRDTCEQLSSKPCFNSQIGLCPGVCIGAINEEDYKKNIKNIKLFFEGKTGEIEKNLNKEMLSFAKKEEFEKAGAVKKTLYSLSHIKDVSVIKEEDNLSEEYMRIESYDIAHISGTSRVGVMTVVGGGEAKKSEYKKFKLEEGINDDVGGYREMLTRRFKHTEWSYPSLLVIDGGVAQKNIAEAIIKSFGLKIPVVSVLKGSDHKAKDLLGSKSLADKYKKEILLANVEAHRFAIKYHKELRDKSLNIPKTKQK
jgi:excinuclease ABC subunit C